MPTRSSINISVNGAVAEPFDCIRADWKDNLYNAIGIRFIGQPMPIASAEYNVVGTQTGTQNATKLVKKLYGSVNGVTKLVYEA